MAAPARGHELCSLRADVGLVPPPPDDWDCDFVKDDVDNCKPIGYDNLATRNPNQANSDLNLPGGDAFGDACDADDDADGVDDWTDGNVDYASSRVKLDKCRTIPDDQADTNGNGIGDACEFDDDRDGVFDSEDNCDDFNPDQADLDGDRAGDVCDNDVDGDYVRNTSDNCPRYPNPPDEAGVQLDRDGDTIGAACDDDDEPPAPVVTATPGPTPAPAPPGGSSNVVDRQAPRVALRVPSTLRSGEVEDGVVVRVNCSEACAVKAELRVDRKTARALKATVVGRGTAKLEGAATTYAFVRFDAKVRSKLLKRARTALTVRVAVTDPAGNVRRSSESLTLRR